jgi:hypothetical protein
MALDKTTREAALKALDAIKQYSRDGFTYGVDRVHLYYDDVEGDWLNEFDDDEITLAEAVSDGKVAPLGILFPWQRESSSLTLFSAAPPRQSTVSFQEVAAAVWRLHAHQMLNPFQKAQLKVAPVPIFQNIFRKRR